MAAGEFNSSMLDYLELLLGINMLLISEIAVFLFITFWNYLLQDLQ